MKFNNGKSEAIWGPTTRMSAIVSWRQLRRTWQQTKGSRQVSNIEPCEDWATGKAYSPAVVKSHYVLGWKDTRKGEELLKQKDKSRWCRAAGDRFRWEIRNVLSCGAISYLEELDQKPVCLCDRANGSMSAELL